MVLLSVSSLGNDVFDFEKGADTKDRLGPPRAAQMGLLTPHALRLGMTVAFLAALAVGVYLTAVAGPVIVVIGLLAIASAIAYTGGPYPLGYHGLGGVFLLGFFRFVALPGAALVQAGPVSPLSPC